MRKSSTRAARSSLVCFRACADCFFGLSSPLLSCIHLGAEVAQTIFVFEPQNRWPSQELRKIFEEGPPTIAKPDVFHEMERAAMRLTALVGYRGAGRRLNLRSCFDRWPKAHSIWLAVLGLRLFLWALVMALCWILVWWGLLYGPPF